MDVNIEASGIFEWLMNSRHRINFLIGGRNSSKSWSIALHLLVNKFFKENNKRILVLRATGPAVWDSCLRLILDLLDMYNLPYDQNKTRNEVYSIDGRNNSFMFKGLDDVAKVKSIEHANYIWLEEATEFSYREFIDLDITMRRKTDSINQMFCSCNPVDATHWIKKEVVDKPDENTAIHESTYRDNPFATETDVSRIQRLKDIDINLWRIYGEGKWGILQNRVYPDFKVVDFPKPENVKEISYGLDFGYNDPTALVKIYWLKTGRVIWEEQLYVSGMTNPQLITTLDKIIPERDRKKLEIYADSSEPARIEEIYKHGFNIKPCLKGKTNDGIDLVKTKLEGITKNSVNGIKEMQSYKWKEDKYGNVIDSVVSDNDHFCDAGRYGTHSKAKGGRAVIKVSSLGR